MKNFVKLFVLSMGLVLGTAASLYSQDFPEKDFRKPFNEKTPLSKLARYPKAMEILRSCAPALTGMAADPGSEFSGCGLADLKALTFLPIDARKLEQAITEIKELIIRTEESL